MNTFETAAVISLIDHLSAPLASLAGKVASTNSAFAAAASKMASTGQHLTYQLTVPIASGIKTLLDNGRELAKIENTLDGVIQRRAQAQGLANQAADDWISKQRQVLKEAERVAFSDNGKLSGMMNTKEFRESEMMSIKAGFDAEAAAAIGLSSLDLSLAGRVNQHEATDMLVAVANAWGVSSSKVDEYGNTVKKTFAEIRPEISKVADVMAAMSTNANMTVTQAADAMKFVAPLAHKTGTDMGFVAAQLEAMAESGFKGSEAGVGLRSAYLSLMAPKSTATRGLLNSGVDLNKTRTFEGVTPENYVEQMKRAGLELSIAAANKLFKDAEDDKGQFDPTKFGELSNKFLRRAGKKHSPLAPNLAEKYTQEYLNSHMTDLDIIGSFINIRNQSVTGGALAKAFEKRQIPRELSWLQKPEAGHSDIFAMALERMYGRDAAQKILNGDMNKMTRPEARQFLNTAHSQAEEHAKGIEGAYLKIAASWQRLESAIYDSGGLDHISDLMNKFSDALNYLSKTNPGTINNVIDGLLALATIGPALLIGGRLMQLALGVGRIARALTAFGATLWGFETAMSAAKAATEASKLATAATTVAEGAGTAAGGLRNLSNAMLAFGTTAAMLYGLYDLWQHLTDPEAVKKGLVHHGTPDDGTRLDPGNTLPGVDQDAYDKWKPKDKQDREPLSLTAHRWWQYVKSWNTNLSGSPDFSPELDYAGVGRIGVAGGGLPTLARGGAVSLVEAINAAKNQPVQVTGDLKGEAMLSVRIDPSPLLEAKINAPRAIPLAGKLGQTMAGSNAARSSGFGGFKPTLSGM